MTRHLPFLAAFGPIVLLHVLFIATFPLNNRGGDAGNYAAMFHSGQSSLVHAGGYGFLMHLAVGRWPFAQLATYSPRVFDLGVQVVQHTGALLALVSLFMFVRRLFGPWTAALAAFGVGTNLQLLGATSSTYPEWMQASTLMLTLWAGGRAFVATTGSGKAAMYAAAVACFTWCVLVKFNAAVLACLFVLPLVAERFSLRTKLVWIGVYAGVAAVNVAAYQLLFHYPSTKTYRLTADTGWVLLTRIQHVYGNTLDPTNGIWTKRWLALASALPMRYDYAGPGLFSRVDYVPSETRAQYRPVFDRIVGADERLLDDWLRERQLPRGFTVGVSLIPVCYYVGLFEGTDTAVKVAFEAVRARPGPYVSAVARDTGRALVTWPFYPLFPLPENMARFGFGTKQQVGSGRVLLEQNPLPPSVPYAYRTPIVWWPGVAVFQSLKTASPPALMLTGLAAVAVIAGALRTRRLRRLTAPTAVVFALAAAFMALIVVSCMVLEFRWKELCLAAPLVYTLAAVGATEILQRIRPGDSRLKLA